MCSQILFNVIKTPSFLAFTFMFVYIHIGSWLSWSPWSSWTECNGKSGMYSESGSRSRTRWRKQHLTGKDRRGGHETIQYTLLNKNTSDSIQTTSEVCEIPEPTGISFCTTFWIIDE